MPRPHRKRMNTFLRSMFTHEMSISNGTKLIKHVRLSRGEYYRRTMITVARQTGTGVLKFITHVHVFDKPTRQRRCVIGRVRMSRYNGNEREKSSFGIPSLYYSALLAETRGKVGYITPDSRC